MSLRQNPYCYAQHSVKGVSLCPWSAAEQTDLSVCCGPCAALECISIISKNLAFTCTIRGAYSFNLCFRHWQSKFLVRPAYICIFFCPVFCCNCIILLCVKCNKYVYSSWWENNIRVTDYLRKILSGIWNAFGGTVMSHERKNMFFSPGLYNI